jgi:hypothetical protein
MRNVELIKKITSTLAAASMLFVFNAFARADGTTDCTNIQTDKGIVTGVADAKSNTCVYKGIPYAAPPVGKLRFARPVEHDAWTATLNATSQANECIQFPMSLMPSTKVIGTEDCLYRRRICLRFQELADV